MGISNSDRLRREPIFCLSESRGATVERVQCAGAHQHRMGVCDSENMRREAARGDRHSGDGRNFTVCIYKRNLVAVHSLNLASRQLLDRNYTFS